MDFCLITVVWPVDAGEKHNIALPYRGQVAPSMPSEKELSALPHGPCRHVLLRSRMVRGNSTTSGPTPHSGLGLQGYVQFTSPIRRYGDMLAHFQLKVMLLPHTASPQRSFVIKGVTLQARPVFRMLG